MVHCAARAGAINILESPDRPTLDPVSESCLRCHDEISVSGRDATDISIPSHTGPNSGGPSHPVGILYELSQSTSPDRFLPISMLSPDIELADSRIG